MFVFSAIVAMSENRVIAKNGSIPWHFSDDLRWFKHVTLGRTIVMGRKTYESIGRPLPGRKTVVLTRNVNSIPGVELCHDAEQLVTRWRRNASFEQAAESMIIAGGGEIYRQFLPHCTSLFLTRVKQTVEGDTFFPPLDAIYQFAQVVHENGDFRVEKWINSENAGRDPSENPDVEWPLA